MKLLIIVIMALVLRLISLNQSLWLDEAINVIEAKNGSFLYLLTEYPKFDFHPPGYFLILKAWGELFGWSEISVRFPSIIFGLITIYLVYKLVSGFKNQRLGLAAAFLMAVNPLHIYYSQEARMYSFACLAVVLNYLLFYRFISQNKQFILYLASIPLVLASDYLAYLIFPAQFLTLIIGYRRLLKRWLWSLLPVGGYLGLWLPIFIDQFNIGLKTAETFKGWKDVVGETGLKPILLTYLKFVVGRISFDNKLPYYLVSGIVLTFISSLIFNYLSKLKIKENLYLYLWLGVPLILAALISIQVPVLSYFRVLFILPAFIVLIVLAINDLKSYLLQRVSFSIITLVFLISSSIYLCNSNQQREDWKGLYNFLISNQQDSIILMESNGLFSPFAYYSQDRLNAKGGLINIPAKNEGDLIDINSLTEKDVYLLEYLVDITDPQRLLKKALDNSKYSYNTTYDWNGVGFVHYYQLNE